MIIALLLKVFMMLKMKSCDILYNIWLHKRDESKNFFSIVLLQKWNHLIKLFLNTQISNLIFKTNVCRSQKVRLKDITFEIGIFMTKYSFELKKKVILGAYETIHVDKVET